MPPDCQWGPTQLSESAAPAISLDGQSPCGRVGTSLCGRDHVPEGVATTHAEKRRQEDTSQRTA
jgi:hypothetical protein